jgi:glycosyltransferase involved in cell wall biosynthesis
MGAWPRPALPPAPEAGFEVLYYGGYIPLHGLEHVLDAARRLTSLPDVRFTLVGDGQEYTRVRRLAQEWGLPNVRFAREWLAEDELVARYLAPAHVCLGVFGASAKAARVVPAKVLLALAAGRAVVTRDSPAAREALADGEHAVLCAAADGAALADALCRLRADGTLRARLAAAGPPLVAARYAPGPLGRQLLSVLTAAASSPRSTVTAWPPRYTRPSPTRTRTTPPRAEA